MALDTGRAKVLLRCTDTWWYHKYSLVLSCLPGSLPSIPRSWEPKRRLCHPLVGVYIHHRLDESLEKLAFKECLLREMTAEAGEIELCGSHK